MRGILAHPIVLHTANDEEIAFPAGAQVDIKSDDSWQHDISDADIREAISLLD